MVNQYAVKSVFLDEGISGGLFDRPAMKLLIQYLDGHPTDNFYIIFDDISRFARDLKTHLLLRAELKSRGAILKCLNFNFDDSIESELSENISASVAQYDRQKNRRQVIQKMKARVEMGCWPFCPPPGLKYVKNPTYGKLLTPDDPLASIYAETYRRCANGSLDSLEVVRKFILSEYKKHDVKRKLSLSGTKNILQEILYTGFIEYKHWDIPLFKGHHTGFITLEQYKAVQEKLFSKPRTHIRRDYNPNFPLRSFVLCSVCNCPMTGAMPLGNKRKPYFYYWCKTKGCPNKNKTVSTKKMEGEFELLFKKMILTKERVKLAKEILKDVWEKKKDDNHIYQIKTKDRIIDIEDRIASLIGRISATSDRELVQMYEKQLKSFNQELKGIESELIGDPYTPEEFRNATEMVFETLKEPVAMWKSNDIIKKRTVLQMYFDQKLTYDLKEGFRNVQLAHAIKLINGSDFKKNQHVEMSGIEPESEKTLIKMFSLE